MGGEERGLEAGVRGGVSGSRYCALAPLAGRGHGIWFNNFGLGEGPSIPPLTRIVSLTHSFA